MTKSKIKTAALAAAAAALTFAAFCVAGKSAMRIIYPIKFSESVERYSSEYGVEKELIYAVIRTESSFKPDAVSSAGALGLAQITPETMEWLQTKLGERGSEIDLFDPETSVKYGTFLLGYLLNEFKNRDVALAAYHAGRGRVGKWLGNSELSPDGKTLDKIPAPETARYVRKVNGAAEVYRKLYFK